MLTAATVAALCVALPARMTTPSTAATQTPADAMAWQIDGGHSSPTFSVKHLVVSTVRGHMGPMSGTVWYDGKNVSSIRTDATIDVKKLSTNNDARDKDLLGEDFFAADKVPTMTFKSKRVEPVDAGHFKLIGDLTIRGNTREVVLNVEGPSPIVKTARDQRVAATATTTINRFDYGLKWNAFIEGAAVAGTDVSITLDIEATRPPG